MSLNNLNMIYVADNGNNEEFENGAILKCGEWSIQQIDNWVDGFDLDMLETVKGWLNSDAHISEGLYLKVWADQ